MVMTVIFSILVFLRSSSVEAISYLSFLRFVTLFPVILALWSGLEPLLLVNDAKTKTAAVHVASSSPSGGKSNHRQTKKKKPPADWWRSLIPFSLVTTVCAAQLPTTISAGIGGLSVMVFSMFTLPPGTTAAAEEEGRRKREELSSSSSSSGKLESSTAAAMRGKESEKNDIIELLKSLSLLVAVMLSENFMIWVVSATFEAGWSMETAPPPLQDNGARILKNVVFQGLTKRQVVGLRRTWNVQWSLVSGMLSTFLVLDVFHPRGRTLYRLANRTVCTLAGARFIRTASFLMTVLPSQNINCYNNHFPNPPPENWGDWIWVGLQPAARGGCNDLIVSGHATVISMLACVVSSVADHTLFSIAIWMLVIMDFGVEIYEGFHYSVDMWMGLVLVTLLWRVFRHLEKEEDEDSANRLTDSNNIINVCGARSLWRSIALYCPPTILAFLQLTVLPEWTVNFLLVLYLLTGIIMYAGFAVQRPSQQQQNQAVSSSTARYQHYSQHILLSMLYFVLGSYL